MSLGRPLCGDSHCQHNTLKASEKSCRKETCLPLFNQGWAHFSLKDQVVNVGGFAGIYSLSQLLNLAVVISKQL